MKDNLYPCGIRDGKPVKYLGKFSFLSNDYICEFIQFFFNISYFYRALFLYDNYIKSSNIKIKNKQLHQH